MQQGKSLVELAEELQRQKDAKVDYVADSRALSLTGNALYLSISSSKYPINDHAHSQISDRLGIPAKYYQRMRVDAPELLEDNVNGWFNKEPEKRMIRTLDGKVRAFLSNRYRPLENSDLLEVVLPKLTEAGAEIQSCEITEKWMYLKATIPDQRVEIGPPEGFESGRGSKAVHVIEPGIVISNSEVGAGVLSISPAVHTIHSSNLAVMREMRERSRLYKIHLGEPVEIEGGKDVARQTRRLMDATAWNQVKDIVDVVTNADTFEKIVDRLREARARPVGNKLDKTVERLGDLSDLYEEEQDAVLSYLIQGSDFTQYGLHEAITSTANVVRSYERASKLEELGGWVIRLTDNDWPSIAEPTYLAFLYETRLMKKLERNGER